MKILVCGGRDFTDESFVLRELTRIYRSELMKNLPMPVEYDDLTVISGCAKGPDTFAIHWANYLGLRVERYPARWDKYGKAAGPMRNQQMIDEGKPDLVIAFPGRTGTNDMKHRARKHNIPVIEIAYDKENN
jgi:hypothetical protein